MTSKNTTFKIEPLLLAPAFKDYLWGGNRLNTIFNKNIDTDILAETWECSTHPDGLCTIANGCFQGKPLKSILKEYPELMGKAYNPDGDLPILVKLIDAKKDLSVQVHPDDEYAREFENGSLGKTEMWYVLDAPENAKLVYGFNHNMSEEKIRAAVEKGTLTKYLKYESINKNDVFVINPGCVHAIGAGALIAEIQESSNLTYRLYDYDRVDKHGNKRELHLDKALQVATLKKSGSPIQPMRVLNYKPGFASELLCRCQYFQVNRVLLNTEGPRNIDFTNENESFQVLLCVDGAASVNGLAFKAGQCVFIPAALKKYQITGSCQLLLIQC